MVLWVKQILGHFFFLQQNMKCKNILIKKYFFVEIDIIIFRWKISAIRRCSVSYIHVCLFVCFFCFVFPICLRKQPTLGYTTTGFPVKWQLGCVLCRKFASTNQMHYPDLGNKTSSVWNFYSHSSDQCHFIGKSVMDCQERSWWCSHATLLSPLVVRCTLHTHSCTD